jgi:NAD(P)-dependent dehydrogenase (short-subunit alcohol dehydrogenase family)
MTILIIGAGKGIGLETVKLALGAGHSVRALSRSATAKTNAPKRWAYFATSSGERLGASFSALTATAATNIAGMTSQSRHPASSYRTKPP